MHQLVQQCKVRHVRALFDRSLNRKNLAFTASKVEADLDSHNDALWNFSPRPYPLYHQKRTCALATTDVGYRPEADTCSELGGPLRVSQYATSVVLMIAVDRTAK